MKSVLRDIRHLAAIPALASTDRGEWVERHKDETKNARIAARREERSRTQYAAASAALLPDLKPYLIDRQHDARIVGWRREGERFTLTAHDEDLAMIVDWKYGPALETGVDYWEVGMPFDLVFEGVHYVGWREERSTGELIPFSEPRERPLRYTEWLNDVLIDPELPGVRWALAIHHQRYEGGHFRGHKSLVLLIEAESVRVVERQREAWLAHFGADEIDLFDRYDAVRAEVSLAHDPERLNDFGVAWPIRRT